MPALLDHRFLFVVGKGGVGKTTVSAALGLAAARKGKRVLIAMTNVKERLSQLLEVPPIQDEVVRVAPNLDAVNMTPTKALEEYGLMILKVKTVYKAVFENRFVRAFLRGTPGLEAWTMLGKAYFHAVGHGPDGRGDYDLVILDAPATGHGLDMLRVPQVIVNVAPPGLLRREAERALALFRDPERAGAVLVALPEDMPTNESIELHQALENELSIHVPALVVNQLLPKLFEPAEREVLRNLPSQLDEDSPIATLARAGRIRSLREGVQDESLKRLKEAIDVPRIALPHLFAAEFGRSHVESLSQAFG
ncbi:MAG: ArsA family ATPase [Myxococcota bacterium]